MKYQSGHSNNLLAREVYNVSSPGQEYVSEKNRQHSLNVVTSASEYTATDTNSSPNLKAARQRLISDVYGSAGMTLGHGGAQHEIMRITPSRNGPSRENMEEQKRILQAQMNEARARRQEERDKQRAIDEEEERRVRMELANLQKDEQRNLELSKAIAQENYEKVAELQRQKAAEEALARKGLCRSSPSAASRVSPKRVIQAPGDTQWGGPMGIPRDPSFTKSPEKIVRENPQEQGASKSVQSPWSSQDHTSHQLHSHMQPQMQQNYPQSYVPQNYHNQPSHYDAPMDGFTPSQYVQHQHHLLGSPQPNQQNYHSEYYESRNDSSSSSSSSSSNVSGRNVYREKNLVDGFAPVPPRGRGGIDMDMGNMMRGEVGIDPDYALVHWQRKHGFPTRRGNTPGHAQVRSSDTSFVSNSLVGRSDTSFSGETSFVSESKLISDSRLVPSDSSIRNSYSLLSGEQGKYDQPRAGVLPGELPPVEQSLTSDSLLLYLGQRTPTHTPMGSAVSKSMAIPPSGNSPTRQIDTKPKQESEQEVNVVKLRNREPTATYDRSLEGDECNPYVNAQVAVGGKAAFTVHTPSKEEKVALDMSIGKDDDDEIYEEDFS